MPHDDPHQSGDLSDMAVHGTSIPNDAGNNLIPSKPRPGEGVDSVNAVQPAIPLISLAVYVI